MIIEIIIKKQKMSKADMTIIDLFKQDYFSKEFDYLKLLQISELEQISSSILPIIRIENHKYLVGAEQKKITLKENNLIIRVGGGYVNFEEHIKKNAF